MLSFRTLVFLAGCIAMNAVPTLADDRPFLHGLFSDNMVLQRDIAVPVWGWTTPGATVTVAIAGQSTSAVADAGGKWVARVGPFPAGGPYRLEIGGPKKIILENVMFGDVWICSGQSNMEMGIGAAQNGAAELARATNSMIRLYTTPKQTSLRPKTSPGGRWDVCTPATAAQGYWQGFSAVGYFFGRDLQNELNIPIGLIQCAWPGTIAEAWTSIEALKAMPDFVTTATDFETESNDILEHGPGRYQEQIESWWRTNDPGSANGTDWAGPAFDDSAWKSMNLPEHWEVHELPDYDGVVWYRLAVDLPESWTNKDLVLHLGPIDDWDTTWFNGVQVGGLSQWDALRDYPVPAGAVRAGRNVIAIRVLDLGMNGGLWGKPEQLKLEVAGDPSCAPISLAGSWRYCASKELKHASPVPRNIAQEPNAPSVLFNGMLSPLLPFGIKGAIWYQGESNKDHCSQYRELLTALIGDWRARFGLGDFPFLIVQLANFRDTPEEPAVSERSVVREAQRTVSKTIANCGLAVAIDIGNPSDIHPTNKQEVGRRLALSALARVYGKKIEYSGPDFVSYQREDKTIRLIFEHTEGGLVARGGALTGFAIAGSDGRFVPAKAVIDGSTVVVSAASVPEPVAVRYGWADSPECNLYNAAGLPASPFRAEP